jgi:hypothetical protein
MIFVAVTDTAIHLGPGQPYRVIATLPRGAAVECIAQTANGWYRLAGNDDAGGYWVEAAYLELMTTVGELTRELIHPPAFVSPTDRGPAGVGDTDPGAAVTWTWGPRLVGAVQVIGGALEVALGVGGVAVPTPATTVGGIILIAHGSDTIIAGFRTLTSGEITHSLTQTGSTQAARALGASESTARGVGAGVDFVAGVGPSIGVSVTRRLAIAGAETSAERVAVAYLHRGALQMGHNAVGVQTGGTTAWVHFAGVPEGAVVAMARGPGEAYIITEMAVTSQQAARAVVAQKALISAGTQTWRYFGPNCTTTAVRVLQQGGVVVPAWSRTPALLHLGVQAGPEITFMAGALGSTLPDAVGPAPGRR